jgi:hypothetical protein
MVAVVVVAVLPPRSERVSAGSPSRLDRYLRALQADVAAPSRLHVEATGGGPAVDVVVQSTRDVGTDVAAAGGTVNSNLGRGASRILTARVPVAALDGIAAIPGVTRVGASLLLEPSLDVSTNADNTQAQTVWSSVVDAANQPVTGKGVIVAVVDSGIDLTHQDFRKADGSTRVIGLWDQTTGSGGAVAGGVSYAYGSECSPAQINAGICAETDTSGHGTHVAAIAASNGRAYTGATDGSPTGYKGMAPDADLLIVKSDLSTAHVIDGWNWVVAEARTAGKPVVIVNSSGAHFGAHDGTSDVEAAIDALSDAGVVFVVAAGNSGSDKLHGSGQATAGTPSTAKVAFNQSGGLLTTATIDLWYRSADSLAIGVTAPNGTVLGPVVKGEAQTFPLTYTPPGGGTAKPTQIEIHQDGVGPNAQTVHAWVTIRSTSSSVYLQDTWQLTFRADSLGSADGGGGPNPGRWDGWMDGATAGRLNWVDPVAAGTNGGLDYSETLTEPGTARRHVVYDLGEIRGLGYYTGIQFELFVAGVGRAVGYGGRYDSLLALYGADRPAVGFALETDALADLVAEAGS